MAVARRYRCHSKIKYATALGAPVVPPLPQPLRAYLRRRHLTMFWLIKPRLARFNASVWRARAISSLCKPEPARQNTSTSLAWRPVYDKTPASYGIFGLHGYIEFISSNSPLPARKTVTLWRALNQLQHTSLGIAIRSSMLDTPQQIAPEVFLENKDTDSDGGKEVKVKMTMILEHDLAGQLAIKHSWTKDTVTVAFDGYQPLHRDYTNTLTKDHH